LKRLKLLVGLDDVPRSDNAQRGKKYHRQNDGDPLCFVQDTIPPVSGFF
jgi:hypothetical protein